jgi:hypothetical protein
MKKKYILSFSCVFLFGCSGKSEDDVCDEVELPMCELQECPEGYELSHGEACSEDDSDCTTGTGTGRVCVDGTWSVLEPSHGSPGECNQECFFSVE